MSVESTVRAVTTYRLTEMKQRGEKIAMLTSYDYSMAKIVDAAGIDVILVGDSAANVMAGYETTVPITLDMMIYHARSVVRAVERALVVVDLPFGTYQGNSKVALDSAIRIMKETEADAVKMEGGEEILESVQRILSAGIPVMGHLGLTPQSIHKFGTYAVRAKEEAEAAEQARHDIEARLNRFARRRDLASTAVFGIAAALLLVWAGGDFGGQPGEAANWIAAFVLGFFPLIDAFAPLPAAAAEPAIEDIEHALPVATEPADAEPIPLDAEGAATLERRMGEWIIAACKDKRLAFALDRTRSASAGQPDQNAHHSRLRREHIRNRAARDRTG